MNKKKLRSVMRSQHPAAGTVKAFSVMRESCRFYRGIKLKESSLQCAHPEVTRSCSNWCAMDLCPLLRERAEFEGLGWG